MMHFIQETEIAFPETNKRDLRLLIAAKKLTNKQYVLLINVAENMGAL